MRKTHTAAKKMKICKELDKEGDGRVEGGFLGVLRNYPGGIEEVS